MKLAILSDIHANLRALEAVLKDARKRNFERLRSIRDIRHLICNADGAVFPQHEDSLFPRGANNWDTVSEFSVSFARLQNLNTHHS